MCQPAPRKGVLTHRGQTVMVSDKPKARRAINGQHLRVERVRANLTQEELAARWGLSRETVGRMERSADPLPRWVSDALVGLAASCKK